MPGLSEARDLLQKLKVLFAHARHTRLRVVEGLDACPSLPLVTRGSLQKSVSQGDTRQGKSTLTQLKVSQTSQSTS